MRNDTEHLLSSPVNAERLRKAIAEMNQLYDSITEEPIPEDMKRLLDRLN